LSISKNPELLGAHNLHKMRPIFKIRPDLDSNRQNEENIEARFLIAA